MKRSILLCGCVLLSVSLCSNVFAQNSQTLNAQQERDEILMLATYAVVYQDWQEPRKDSQQKRGRGNNIGAILVDDKGQIVHWARNCNGVAHNTTQHAELRLILGYLSKVNQKNLKGYTIYSTLEPCAQCSGMMIVSRVSRVVYGQTDPSCGKTIERLKFDSYSISEDGYKPYGGINRISSLKSTTEACSRLDEAMKKHTGRFTRFFFTPEAKEVYEKAVKEFNTYAPVHAENTAVLRAAQKYIVQRVVKGSQKIVLP